MSWVAASVSVHVEISPVLPAKAESLTSWDLKGCELAMNIDGDLLNQFRSYELKPKARERERRLLWDFDQIGSKNEWAALDERKFCSVLG